MKNRTINCAYVAELILVAIALSSSWALAQSPSITSISPAGGVVGMPVQITGSGFGATQGSSTVALNGISASATSWSDGGISVIVPTGATSGPFLVTVGGQGASSASFTVNALPSGWTDTDIGTVGLAGSSSYANGTFTVKGAGAGIWSTADAFHFVYQPLSGNGTIVARVVNMPVGAVAGVMVRETLNAGAMNGKTADYLSSSTYAYVGFDIRTSTGGSTTEPSYVSGTLPPYWVELVRNGSTFSSYTSPDGINWTQLGSSQTIGMATNAYVGLGVSSRSTSSLATVTFDNVSVSPATSPGPVISSVSATTGSAGSQVVLNGSGFGSSQSTSLVTLNTVPVIINSWGATSITVTIPSSATTGIMVVSLGPSMNDSNPIWFTVTAQPLPSGWLDGDLGAVGKTGSAGYTNGVFTVNGAGAALGGAADAFHFVYQPMSGNGSIIARVVSTPVDTSAGVMVRETLNPGATNAITLAYPTNSTGGYINFDMRATTGGSLTNPAFLSGPHPPYWVEVVRSGNTFSSYASPDGINWTEVGSPETITMAQNVYVGLMVNSSSTTSLASATFDNVSVNSGTTSAPVITSVSATTGSVGSQVVINGSGFGASQGSSLVTLNAAPVTIDTWDNNAITVTIPSSATSGLLVVSLGPSMDDSNPVWFTVTSQPLPSGWLDGDVGAVGKAGSATYSSGVFTVNGAGTNIWGTADAFHFAYLPVTGNGSIIARVVSMSVGSQAGVMVRETLNAGATNAKPAEHLSSSTSAYIGFDVRTSTGGSTTEPSYLNGTVPPYWIEVVRSGSTFTAYTSTNGTSWTQLGTSQTISMAQNAYVGLAVDSGNITSLATATFDNVSSTFGAQIVAPSIAAVSPTSSVPLVPVTITGSNFGSSQGSSTVTFNGVPATPTSWNSTTIVAPVPLTATTGNVVVTVNGASSNGVAFTVSQTPTINALSPSSGPVGTSVTINGVNFGSSQGSSTVTFNGMAATPTAWSATAIGVAVPTGATTGNVVVTVGGTASSGVLFTVYPIPTITSLSASSATIGAPITITGNNFGSSAGTSTVTFNGVVGTPTSWSSTSIVALVPFGATSGNVVVTENGIASNAVPVTITMVSLPTVSQVLPANGSTGVPENTRIVVRFAQPVPQIAVIPGTVSLFQGTTPVSGTLTLSNDGLSVTFIPAQNLVTTTAFNVSVTDLTGNQSSAEFQSSFTTGSTTDTVAPSLVLTSPQNNSTGVPISAPIVVQFSKAMDPGTLTPQTFAVADTFTGNAINGMVQVDPTGTTASFVPQPNLPVGRTFLVQLHTTIEDQSGNSLTSTSGDTFGFTTSFTADTTAPQVVGMSPSNGTTGVPLNSLIVLQFSKPLDVISVSQGLQVQAGGQTVPGAIALSSSNQLVTFTPTGSLAANTTYTISLTSQITDVGSLALSNPQSFSLTTGTASDTTTPSVAVVAPQNSATGVPINGVIQVQFSKPVDPFTVTNATLQVLVGNNSIVPGTISVSGNTQSATFTPSAPLSAFTIYQVEATTGITDPEGHPLAFFLSRFTTGATTAGSAPTVQIISPPNSASGVPANVRVDVTVSTALDPATVSNSTIIVSSNGNAVSGTVTLGNGGTTLTWLPTTLLTASTSYSVTVSGVTDQAGNLLTPFTSSFTTAASGTANTTTPSVVSVSPANGATAVPASSTIVLTFNEAIDLTSVSDTTVPIQVTSLSGTVAGSYALDSTGTVLTFTPLSPLPGNATVSVAVVNQGVLDLSGNMSGSYYSTFTTGTGTDTTSPTVTMVTPSNGATGITPNTPIVLTFSKSLNPNTVTAGNLAVLVNGTVQPEGISRSADNRVITLGGTSLPASSTVTVLATSGLTDLNGNPLVNFQSEFTTGATSVGPTVTSQRPGNGATLVPSTASVVLYLSQPMNSSTVTGALHVSQNGVIVSGTIQVSDNGQVVQFFPSAAFLPSAVVQVFLDSSAQSLSGINLNAYQSSFTTAPNYSTTTPTQVATNPLNGGTVVATNEVIDIAFNVPLDPNTLTADAVVCYQNGTWFQSDVGLIDGGSIIQIAPRYPLPANTGISCQLYPSLEGTNGVPLSGPWNMTFTTGTGPDTLLPTIQTVSPPNGSSNVGDNAIVRLVFNKPINPLTVNATTVELTGNGTTFVADSISFSNNNQMALLAPHSPLPDNTLMTLTISGITDGASNPVAPQTTQFTTGTGPDVTAPLLVSANPLQTNINQPPTNIPLNTVVQLQVNEPVDPGTVNSNTFQVLQGGQHVPGTYSVSADGQTLSFVPSSFLAPNQSYAVNSAGTGITDLAGNMLMNAVNGGPVNISFTTGTSPTTNAPQVTGTSPATGATNIPINAQVVVQFNEPISATKLSGVYLTGPGGTVAASQTLTNANQTLTLIPTTVLVAGAQYTMNIAGVQDMGGNVLVAPVTVTFTTGTSADLNPPQVASTSPASYATGVSTSATVQVQFNKAIDPLTVTASTFELFPYSTLVPVPGVISFSPDGATVTFTPSQPLDSATSYVISLKSGIIDIEGHTLQPMNYYFTTSQGTSGLTPVIATTSPSAAGVGTSVTINGTYFGTSQGSSTVTFNGVPATVSSWSDVQIVTSVPNGATTGPLVVTVNGTNSNTPQFDVTATPVISSISPSSATVGTVLTITGTNFGDTADSVGVSFPQNLYPPPPPLTPISRSQTSITVAVPYAAMSGNVIVAVDGVSSAGSAFIFIPTPNITSLSTYSGVPGTSVYIFGTNFGVSQGSSTVYFNGVPASVTGWENSQVIAVAPGNVTTGPVTVVANSVSSNSNVVFTVTTPAISNLSPPNAAAGATVTLNGSGLAAQGLTTQVFFNGVAASVASASSNSVTVVVPANATSGLVTAVVGPDTSDGVEFTLESPPVISAVSPTSAPYGGVVTITGSGFGATQSSSSVILWQGVPAQISSWSDTSIQVIVPDGASSGPSSVEVGGVTAQGPWIYINTSIQVTDSLGNQTTYQSMISGGQWVLASSQGSGCSSCTVRGNITNVPDANGNVLTSADDLGNTTTYTYDSNNNMTSASRPLNANTTQTTSYTYNSFGEVLTTTDPLGNVTTNTYDANGNLLTVTTPAPNSNTPASVTQFQYATNGELTQITDPKGNATKLTYTPAGLIASITDAQNNVTTYQYDARGNRTAVIDPINGASHPTSFAYDNMNRLTGITYPDGSTAGFTYDIRGRRTSSTDQNGRTTTYTYDDADRLTAVTDPANHSTEYAYDTENNLVSITDANNHTTQFAYNTRGWVTQTTFPSTLQESYTYDAMGHLLSKTDRKNQTIQYVYDALYRLASKTYPDSTSVEYAYDLAGKVLQVSDPTGSYGFAYDNMGRLIGTSTQYSYLPGVNFQNAYTYDSASNRTSLTAPDGTVTTYGYDTLNRLNGLANTWAGTFGFGYDALSRRTSLTRPNGVNTSYGYDSQSRMLSVLHQAGANTLDGASYTYDAAGNRTSKTNYLNGVTSNYGYDPLYELTQVTQGGSTTESYSYDPVRNRLSSSGVPNYSYNSSNEMTSNSNGSYVYDANGNVLVDSQGRTYTWDFDNRLTQVVVPGTNGGTTTFKYDPFGRRIQKSGPLGTTNYLYDGANVSEEVDSTGNFLARYTQGTVIDDEHLSELRSNINSYYQQDALGSVTSLSDSSGAFAKTYSYDSFGNVTASTGTLTNPFQFTGRDLDSETGLYNYRSRYYDSTVGRFESEDSIRFEAGINFYAYVSNHPTDFSDPSGMTCIKKLMLVTSYCDLGTTASGAPAGPGSVAVANTKPKPYPFGCSVTVTNPNNQDVEYRGTTQDTGAGWNPAHHNVPADQWIDIWLRPCKTARQYGKRWREVEICCNDCK